jgi:PilZ domain-containing protein
MSIESKIQDRRAYRRFQASRLRGLTATTLYSPQPLNIIDVSSGGALIESDRRLIPGERESLAFSGPQAIRVAGKVLRVEIVRLHPRLVYRSAIQFARPIALQIAEPAISELHQRVQDELRALPCVDRVSVCAPGAVGAADDSIYFDISPSIDDERRVLQIFFPPGVVPTADEFQKLRTLARLASEVGALDQG